MFGAGSRQLKQVAWMLVTTLCSCLARTVIRQTRARWDETPDDYILLESSQLVTLAHDGGQIPARHVGAKRALMSTGLRLMQKGVLSGCTHGPHETPAIHLP